MHLREYDSKRVSSSDPPVPIGMVAKRLRRARVVCSQTSTAQESFVNLGDHRLAGEVPLKKLVLRMYWDGEATPSVEAPIGDFFGLNLGEYVEYEAAPPRSAT